MSEMIKGLLMVQSKITILITFTIEDTDDYDDDWYIDLERNGSNVHYKLTPESKLMCYHIYTDVC